MRRGVSLFIFGGTKGSSATWGAVEKPVLSLPKEPPVFLCFMGVMPRPGARFTAPWYKQGFGCPKDVGDPSTLRFQRRRNLAPQTSWSFRWQKVRPEAPGLLQRPLLAPLRDGRVIS